MYLPIIRNIGIHTKSKMKVTLTINTVDSIPETLDSALYMLRHALTP